MASRSWNRVELIGNLTRDPELRFTPNGAAVCTFGIATNRTYVSEGERKEEVDFHKLVTWNKLAELCNQLLKKGHRVFISGRLQTRSWEGQDGQTRQTTEIVIEDMILLTPKSVNGDIVGISENVNVENIPQVPSPAVSKAAPKPDEEVEETSEAEGKSADETSEEKEAAGKKDEKSKPAAKTQTDPQENVSEDEDLPF